MSYKSSKWFLLTLAMITTSLVTLYLSFFALGQDAPHNRDLAEMPSKGRVVPPSRTAMPPELADRAEIQTQKFLEFFKTQTQQLMPLGFFAMAHDMENVAVLSRLRRHGINLAHLYGSVQDVEHALADLRAAEKAGIGVLQNLPRAYMTTRGADFWQRHISALAGNEQILVWYLPEEVKPEEIGSLSRIANIIRATDTQKRPLMTYLADSEPAYLRKVSDIADVIILGAYPSLYMPRPRADIKCRIDKAYQSGVPVVVAALESLKGRRNWTRPKDVRCDAYLALISGAKGIMWYGYYYAKSRTQLMDAILQVATQLNGPMRLGEVLLLGKETTSLACELMKGPKLAPPASAYEKDWQKKKLFKHYDSIQWTARKHKGNLYIFAVNIAQRLVSGPATDDGGLSYNLTARFGPLSSNASEVEVIGEERTIIPVTNYFSDTFKPLAVHIYKVALE